MMALDAFKGRAKRIPEEPDRILLPFQEKWRADKSRLKLAEKSRQIGWTWSDALSAMEEASAGLNDVWVSSRDELQAKLYLDDVQFWSKLYNAGAQAMGLTEILDEDGKSHSAFVTRFPSGKNIYSLSSNPDAQAGKRGTRKLDEFALHKDPKRLYDIAYPGITWGGSLCGFSTHRGAANYFNQLIREIVEDGNPKGFSHHRVTLEDALDQGLLFKLQQRLPETDPRMEMDESDYFDFIRAGATDESAFLQEYMCVPEDEASAFITQDMLSACSYNKADNLVEHTEDVEDRIRGRKGRIRTLLPQGVSPDGLPRHLAAKELYVGIDYGRHKDLTVVWVWEKVSGMHFTAAVIAMEKVPFWRQAEEYDPILMLCQRACLDETGMGEKPVEDAQREHNAWKIEGVKFTGPVKQDLAYPLRAGFEDRSLRVPYDKPIHADFRLIKKQTTLAGNVRLEADAGNTHADYFWSAALGLHAAKSDGPIHVAGVSRAGMRKPARKAW